MISIGHGVVMGGGLGVFSGARYRIVTDTSRVAMPEVTIGLFPDAGATWLLHRMPRHLATFLALTGAHLNGADALATGIGTHAIATTRRGDVLDALLQAPWAGRADGDHERVEACLSDLPAPELSPGRVHDVPATLSAEGSALDVAERVRALHGRSDWIDGGIAAMNRGCPTSVGIVAGQLERAQSLDLADCFRLEMIVATHCANHPDFAEGVRALIIDKDNRPRWRYQSVEALPGEYVAEHFEPPWRHNPLEDLEETS
jgi:enoyl-CoA hydratase/carnithine racemase